MKKFSELDSIHRADPCQEYPGRWILYYAWRNKNEPHIFDSLQKAVNHGDMVAKKFLESKSPETELDMCICWEASDDDPRIGSLWFTAFYRVGKYNQSGQFVMK